jgi:GntR family transcriptional regulator
MTAPAHIARPDRRRPEPLWHQAGEALRALIADGTWPDGTQIPNEAKLSEMLGISRITVRHALRNLEEVGLLRREHGRGTFVRSSTVIAGVRGLTSFTQEMAERGLVVGSRVLELAEIPAAAEVADALEIPVGTPVCMIRRLRAGNNLPMGIQTAYLPASRVPGLAAWSEPLPSLYELLRNRFGIIPEVAREIYRVGTVSAADAEFLDVPAGSPAFIVQRIASDSKAPFEFTLSTMRGDRYEIRSKLYL